MKRNRKIVILNIVFISLFGILFISCTGNSVKRGMLVATEAPGNIWNQNHISGESLRYMQGSRIIAFDPDKPANIKVLTEDFYSACFPEISYDGSRMLFTAQQKADDPWQIWEMDLEKLKSRKITSFNENCTDPAYLPGGRMVFSKLTVNDTVKTAYCLYTCNIDGSNISQITFSPHTSFATTILKDGRLLSVSSQLLPKQGEPMLMVMRPDGTKADRFYKGATGSLLISDPRETFDRKIVFIESTIENRTPGDLISINYNRPLHTRINLTSDVKEDLLYVLPLSSDKYLISSRSTNSEKFALYEFNPEKKLIGKLVFSDPEYNIIDVVALKEIERPKKLPSEVDMQVKTGLLLCQNINLLNPSVNSIDIPEARKIEVLGIDSTYGVVDVEDDGSFYLKVMADTPFRIRTLDKNGRVINGPCSWLWLRPNERRGCVGCHEDPELVPQNRVSLAVKKSPVIIPVHIAQVKEKIVELE